MVDKTLLRERLKFLVEYIGDLEELQNLSYSQFSQDKRIRRYVERTLHLAIESCLDIANHIIADLQLREPEDNKDLFAVLVEAGIIPPEDLDTFGKMAQFRNVIVHHYVKLDPEIVFSVLKNNLGDIRRFGAWIEKSLL